MDLLTIVLLIGGGLIITFVFYEGFYKPRALKKAGKIIRILLYENIGDTLVYKGERLGEIKNSDDLGYYIYIKKGKISINLINSREFEQDYKYGKALTIIKYSDDDYRPLVKLKQDRWMRLEKVAQYEKVQVEDESGEIRVIEKLRRDEKDRPVFETKWREYKEPHGVTQEGREALRFVLDYKKELEKRYGEKKSWLERVLPYATVGVVAMILLIGFVQMNNKFNEAMVKVSENIGQEIEGFEKEINSPSFVEGLYNNYIRQEQEENAPPS